MHIRPTRTTFTWQYLYKWDREELCIKILGTNIKDGHRDYVVSVLYLVTIKAENRQTPVSMWSVSNEMHDFASCKP